MKVYESSFVDDAGNGNHHETLIEISYGIETGEAERIAVDGVARGGVGKDGDESSGSCAKRTNS